MSDSEKPWMSRWPMWKWVALVGLVVVLLGMVTQPRPQGLKEDPKPPSTEGAMIVVYGP